MIKTLDRARIASKANVHANFYRKRGSHPENNNRTKENF